MVYFKKAMQAYRVKIAVAQMKDVLKFVKVLKNKLLYLRRGKSTNN